MSQQLSLCHVELVGPLSVYRYTLVRKKIRKRRLFKKVQAFCEEKVLRYLSGVFWFATSKNQCWHAENGVFTF